MGYIGYKEGYSSNIVSRAYAFGKKGQIIASLIWSFVIIGILGVESVLIGESILFYFNIEGTLTVKIIMYVIMALVWILLSLFGTKIVAKVNAILVPLFFVVLLYIIYLMMGEKPLSGMFSGDILFPGMSIGEGFSIALNACITMAGLSTIVLTDFTRFAKSGKDVVKVSLSTGIGMFGVTMMLGAILTYLGFELTQNILSH